MSLPGIGSATAGGVMAFAHNEPGLYLETNVRTVFLHEFFPEEDQVPDKVLEPYVLKTCSRIIHEIGIMRFWITGTISKRHFRILRVVQNITPNNLPLKVQEDKSVQNW